MEKFELIINEKYNEFVNNKIDDTYQKLYTTNSKDEFIKRIMFIFSCLHQLLNNYLKEFNNRINTIEKHYRAEDSRQLIILIDTIFDLKENTNSSQYSFKMDNRYESYLKQIRPCLKQTLGTSIPETIKEISIIKYDSIFKLDFDESVFIHLNESSEQILKSVSTRDSRFINMTLDEKLENINQALENVLKINGKYIDIDSEEWFCNVVSEENIKDYRKLTHCFRHGEGSSLAERKGYSENQKIFLINFGITILNAIIKSKEAKI